MKWGAAPNMRWYYRCWRVSITQPPATTELSLLWITVRKKMKKSEFSLNLKMLSFFCFSKLGAPLFRFFLSRPETSISGENPCFPISGGHVHQTFFFLHFFCRILHFWVWKILHFFCRKNKKCRKNCRKKKVLKVFLKP